MKRTALRVNAAALLLALLVSGCDRTADDAARPAAPVHVEAAPLATPDDSGDGAVDPLDVEADFGEVLYQRNCQVCHGRNGGGDVGPPLADNDNLEQQDYVVARILLGGGGMPPFAPQLTAAELAAVGSYVRTTWGNEFGSVSPEAFERQWFGSRLGEPLIGTASEGADGAEDAAEAAQDPAGASRDLQPWGAELYANVGCVGCHSGNGAGGIGPPLSGNAELRDARYVTHKILNGGGGMPAFDTLITDEQVAAIATHIRTSWGNDYGEVAPDAVTSHSGEAVQRLEGAGGRIYERAGCAGCHGSQGGGGVGPPLDGNRTVRNRQYVLTQILYGGGGMPAFADRLSDQEVADVATFVRAAWGNDFGAVMASDAQQRRQAGEQGEAEPRPASTPRGGPPDGSRIYTLRACGSCHGENGEGGLAPALAGNPNVGNTKLVVTQILHGGGGMPPFVQELSSDQLAAVASHVRTAWENDFGEITAEQVDMLRRRAPRAESEGD